MEPRGKSPAEQCIVFTGRLASMSRMEAIHFVHQRGGAVRGRVSLRTDVLVIGADGLPLKKSGAISTNLRRAQQLRDSGHPLIIMEEAEFVRRVMADTQFRSICREYTLEEVSRLLGISGLRLRRWIQLGLVKPIATTAPSPLFDFREVTVARTLSRLVARGVRPAQLVASLRTLQGYLSDAAHLSHHLLAMEKQLWIRDAEDRLIGSTGQLYLPFDDLDPPGDVLSGSFAGGSQSPDALFEQAYLDQLAGRGAAAADGYLQLLATWGDDAAVLFNLANLFYHAHQYAAAVPYYQRCVRHNSRYQAAWNNLGLCHYQLGALPAAVMALRQAVKLAPQQAEALFNLADVLDEAGNTAEARLVWLRLSQLPENNEMTSYARQRMEEMSSRLPMAAWDSPSGAPSEAKT